jgi:phospholipid transport system substrate-binding protein
MTKIYRVLLASLFVMCISLSTGIIKTQANEFNDGAQNFIKSLATNAQASLLAGDLPPPEYKRRFRKLMLDSFDLDRIGKWVVGRYWRRIPLADRVEYQKLFKEFIIATYTKRFKGYTKTKLQINGTTSRKGIALVGTQINRANAKPIHIVWQVDKRSGRYQIINIVVEGISWIETQRSEFVSIIRNNGGKVTGLIAALNEKTLVLATSPN